MSVSLYGSGNTVIQAVSGSLSTQATTTSTSPVASGVLATITPQSTTSKILVVCTIPCLIAASSGYIYATLYRGATNLGTTTYGMGYLQANGTTIAGTIAFNFLDSPSTTSSTTYQIYVSVSTGTGYYMVNNATSTISVLEISGS